MASGAGGKVVYPAVPANTAATTASVTTPTLSQEEIHGKLSGRASAFALPAHYTYTLPQSYVVM